MLARVQLYGQSRQNYVTTFNLCEANKSIKRRTIRSLCSFELQFGFKKDCLQRISLLVCCRNY